MASPVWGLSEQRNGGQGSRKTRKKLPETSSHLVNLGVQGIWQIGQIASWGDQLSHSYPASQQYSQGGGKGEHREGEALPKAI